MKKVLIVATVCLMLIMLVGCGESKESKYTISVTGDKGMPVTGSISVITSEKSNAESVEGVVPLEYEVEGTIVSVSVQKNTDKGNLKVEILKDGEVVQSGDTSAQYGIVSLATQ